MKTAPFYQSPLTFMIHKIYYLSFKETGLKGESKSVWFDFLDLIDII